MGLALSARKKWIKGSLKTAGALTVDDGAVRAPGRQEPAAGSVTSVDGEFRRGDVVDVKDRLGRVLARGLVAYAAEDARRIAGRKSAEIERLLGFRGRDEMVHRDDLVVEWAILERPMNALTKPAEDAAAIVAELGRRARDAAVALRNASTEAKNRALADAARLIRAERPRSWPPMPRTSRPPRPRA